MGLNDFYDLEKRVISIQLCNAAQNSYFGHRVTINYSQRTSLTTPAGVEAIVWSGAQMVADCSAEGRATFTFPANFILDADIYLRVFAEDGTLLLRRPIPAAVVTSYMIFDVEPQVSHPPTKPKMAPQKDGDRFIKTLNTLLERAHSRGVQLIEAPVS